MVACEKALAFRCGDDGLIGILHEPNVPSERGVIVVVGGPQYRIGSHRLFVQFARALAGAGLPVFRFDSRGMGDSHGTKKPFETIGDDIECAITEMKRQLPTVKELILLGLCDGASAATIAGPLIECVSGLILINPWVRPNADPSYPFKHYYLPRLTQLRLWQRLFSGGVDLRRSVPDFFRAIGSAVALRSPGVPESNLPTPEFVECMLNGLETATFPTLILISGADIVGREFLELARNDSAWNRVLEKGEVTIKVIPDADHTLSDREDLELVTSTCSAWLMKA